MIDMIVNIVANIKSRLCSSKYVDAHYLEHPDITELPNMLVKI